MKRFCSTGGREFLKRSCLLQIKKAGDELRKKIIDKRPSLFA